MKKVLDKYIDKEVGINLHNSNTLEKVLLKETFEDYFVVHREKDKTKNSIPYSSLVSIVEGDIGYIEMGNFLTGHKDYSIIIRLGHVVQFVMA